MLSFRCTCKYN